MSINTPRLPGASEVFTDRPDEGPRAVGMNRRGFLAALGIGAVAATLPACFRLDENSGDAVVSVDDPTTGRPIGVRICRKDGMSDEEFYKKLAEYEKRLKIEMKKKPRGAIADVELPEGLFAEECPTDGTGPDGGTDPDPDAEMPPDAPEVMPPVISSVIPDCERTDNECLARGEIYDLNIEGTGNMTDLNIKPRVETGLGEAGEVHYEEKEGVYKYTTGNFAGDQIVFDVLWGPEGEEEVIFTSHPPIILRG